MRRKGINPEKATALQFIHEVIAGVKNSNPSVEEMIRDLKMMKLKIRPLSGDLFSISEKQSNFLESLWKIGKIEEIVHRAVEKLDDNEMTIFFDYIDNLEKQIHDTYSQAVDAMSVEEQERLRVVKLEIFRESPIKKDIN